MNKRRITLNLDVDVVEALRSVGGSMSTVANEALRDALDRRAHQAALGAWLAELNGQHGAPTEVDYREAVALLDALEQGRDVESGAA